MSKILSKKFDLFKNICIRHVMVRFYQKYTIEKYLATNLIYLMFSQSFMFITYPKLVKDT
jgi:hypothetical protein